LAEETRQAKEYALRQQAELENFRKRMRRQMEDERRYAALPLIADLLSVVDNLDRAIEASEQNDNPNGLLEGVKMVVSQFQGVLEKHECRPIAAVGKPFDPHFHEALASEPSDTYPPGMVTRVTLMGYTLHDRVVRPSQVFVSAEPVVPQSNDSSNS
jgi:molecular chaperone GrpE